MGSTRASGSWIAALACAVMAVVVLQPVAAPARNKAHKAVAEQPGFFESIGRWFDQQTNNIASTFGGARSTVEEFGHEAGIAANTTVDNARDAAKDAADAVSRLPSVRVVSGHVKCRVASNGAPDCEAAADAVCRAKGFKSGSSVDMTSAEVCPPKVWIAGRNNGPGCHTVTFVSRAFCQ